METGGIGVRPSDSISEQYQASTVQLTDGKALYGRIIYQNGTEIALAQNPYRLGDVTRAPIGKVKKIEPSQISLMPPGTISLMNQEELQDLMAYLLSGDNRNHAVFGD